MSNAPACNKQLTGSTSNYTINLSGIILLSLSLSAAVMIWGYLYTLFDNTNKSGSSGGGGDYSYNGGGGYKVNRVMVVMRSVARPADQ